MMGIVVVILLVCVNRLCCDPYFEMRVIERLHMNIPRVFCVFFVGDEVAGSPRHVGWFTGSEHQVGPWEAQDDDDQMHACE